MEPVIFGTLSDLLQDITMNTIDICLVIKKREKRNQVLSATPEQDQGQDAALGQQAASCLCQGAMHRGTLVPPRGQGAHQALLLCAASPRQLSCSAVWERFGAWFPMGTRQMNSHCA